jgi:FlaG/FlaF family flagellin (archaellin)
MKQSKCVVFGLAFVILAFLCAMTVDIAAQDITHPSTTKQTGEPTHEVQTTHVKNAEVIHVSGHEVVVELENGKFELLNLAEDVKLQVDGKELTVHELTPKTKLSQEIHTVTTPKEVTTFRTVNGKVWAINPPHLILSFPEGENKAYTVPDGIVFHIDGQDKTVFELRKGMQISATVLTVAPEQDVARHTVLTGQASPRPNVTFEGPMLVEPDREVPTLTATVEEPPAQALPKTASRVPLAGVLGFLSLALGAGLRIIRRNARKDF